MSIIVKRKKREIKNTGTISFEVIGSDIGKTYDFMGIAEGFRIKSVNLTVDEAFSNADNKISVGIEEDYERFIASTTVDAVKGIDYNQRQLTANNSMAIVANLTGTSSDNGKATITVEYAKLADSRQEY